MKCPNCDAEVPQGKRFCPQCGMPITETDAGEPARCPHCGATLLPGARFCGQCGREVTPTPPPPPFQTPVPPPVPPGATPPPVTSAPRKRSPGLWIIIAVIALLAVGCATLCGALFIVPSLLPTPTPEATATWTPSPTPQATFTPTPPPTPTPDWQVGELLYEQDFTAPDSDWQNSSSESTIYSLENGAYAIEVLENDMTSWNRILLNLDNFVLELDAGLVAGDKSNAYGVLFAYKDRDNFCNLRINGSGSFTFLKRIGGVWSKIVDWTPHRAIQGPGTLNHITLVHLNGRVKLYINGEFVYELYDDSLSEGQIAVAVMTYDNPPAKAIFDNIRIWRAQ